MPTVSVLCPTRGREQSCKDMITTAMATSSRRCEVLVYLDQDDPDSNGMYWPARKFVGPPDGVGKAWNTLAREAEADFLMMGNDDLRFVTPDWDLALINGDLPADGIFVAWFNDGSATPDRCRVPIVSRRWFEALGYFVPERFHFFYHDTWLEDIGRRLDRLCCNTDVMVRHVHHIGNDGIADATHKRNRMDGQSAADRMTYERLESEREAAAELLRPLMEAI